MYLYVHQRSVEGNIEIHGGDYTHTNKDVREVQGRWWTHVTGLAAEEGPHHPKRGMYLGEAQTL